MRILIRCQSCRYVFVVVLDGKQGLINKKGEMENIKMRGWGIRSQANLHNWLAVIISFCLNFVGWVKNRKGGYGPFVESIDFGDVISVELVLALPVLEFDESFCHYCACFWRT